MENISFQYPAWFLIFCFLLGLVYAAVLYYRDTTFREQATSLNWLLGGLRFLTVSLLSMLLLSPLLKSVITETKKPVVVLAQDQSESISSGMTDEQLAAYRQQFEALGGELGEQYDLKQYAFGDEVREAIDFEFTDKVSNISDLLSRLYDLYSNQNLGAVILATDGIYNEGSNPIYASTKLSAPIYSIALGDTTPQRDLVLKRVFHNKIAYLGDKFSIQIDIAAQNCQGKSTFLNVFKVNGSSTQRLQQIPLNIDRNKYFTTQEVLLDADNSGVQRFRISVNKVDGEVTTGNNSKDIFVDVLDARQKILILAHSPHPDLSAIKQTLVGNKNYEVSVQFASQLQGGVAGYDFVLLHQLPSKFHPIDNVLNTLKAKRISHLFVVGTQTDYSLFNAAQALIDIVADGRNTNDVQATVASNFNLFTLDNSIRQELPQFAPLLAPFGEFKAGPNAQVLLYQRIGKVATQYPLLLFGDQEQAKVGVLVAEGIWKWRLFDYLQHENHDMTAQLLSKSIQYLSLKEDKRKFRISLTKNIFNENERIFFDAELYNESYELINEPDASLTITNSEGKDFHFTFNKSGRSYGLDAGNFPVGNYTFKGAVNTNGQQLTYNGQFSVQPVQLEVYETTADHSLLQLLSNKYGGQLVYPPQMASLAGLINGNGGLKPVIYETSKTRSVINLKWIFFLLLGLLTIEWFFRRYFGGY